MTAKFSAKEWRKEHSALHSGADPVACPRCERTGFYATRDDHPDRRGRQYRSCSFCGFWQDVGKDPYRAIRYECHGRTLTKKPNESWTCPDCGRRFDPEQSEPWPVDDPSHDWWRVPQRLSQKEYITYWELEWGYDAMPFGIV